MKNKYAIYDTSSSVPKIQLMMTSKELSERTGIELTKIRRYVKDILEPDPEATQQSGKSRTHRLNDSFKIYLTNFLVSKYGFITKNAKAILSDIDQWLDKKQIYPEYAQISDAAGWGIVADVFELKDGTTWPEAKIPRYSTEIKIFRANTASGFYYHAIMAIEYKRVHKKGYSVVTTQYVEEPIIPRPEYFICFPMIEYLLSIQALRYDFAKKVGIDHLFSSSVSPNPSVKS